MRRNIKKVAIWAKDSETSMPTCAGVEPMKKKWMVDDGRQVSYC